MLLGVPATAPASETGFRPQREMRSPTRAYEIQQHEVTWAEVNANDVRRTMPAVGLSWQEAHAFCVAAGGDLPTETQWEYAARGPQLRPFPWGDTPLPRPHVNAWQRGAAVLAEVMTNEADRTEGPAAGAIYDLIGNAREWTLDIWRADAADEDDAWATAVGRTYRAVRGLPVAAPADGTPPRVGAAFREPLCAEGRCPADVAAFLPMIGFRCARDVR
jgi:formylglycine-generating enzyme required for sulfatase activity